MAVADDLSDPAGPVHAPEADAGPDRSVRLRHFARLRLRILANGFRGRVARVLLFALGLVAALNLGLTAFLLFAASTAGDAPVRLIVAGLGGAGFVVGSVVLPLVWFGVDDTLHPARFALLPLSRTRLVGGLLVASLTGIPAAGVLLATSGLLVPAGVHGGPVAVAAQALGVAGGLLLCLAAGRAVTSALASVLRSRRIRDLTWVLIACVAGLLGPLQLLISSAVARAEWDRLATVASVLGWTPLAAPYTVGLEVAQQRPAAAVAKLAITAATVAVLLVAWGRALDSALTGAVGTTAPRRGRAADRGPSAQLIPGPLARVLPGVVRPAPFGALVSREVRYWWRDAKRRSNLIVIALVALFVPVFITLGRGSLSGDNGTEVTVGLSGTNAASLTAVYLVALFAGAFAASVLANQFGFDGTAYGTHVVIGVRGRTEMAARAVAYSVFMLPLLLVVGIVVAAVRGDPAAAPATWGVLAAGYGTGVAANLVTSVLAPYPLPESSNPFATGSGDAVAKSLLALVSTVAAGVATVPILLLAWSLDEVWPWVAVPVGIGYGVVAAVLGVRAAGELVDERAPRLLAAVDPGSSK